MNLKLALTCESAREREDGKLDIVGIFDELAAPGFPAMQDRMVVVFVMEWDASEIGRQPLRADLVDDQDQRIVTIQGHADVRRPDGGRLLTRLVMPLQDVVFPHAGDYHFELIAGGDTARACSLHLLETPAV